MSDELLKALLPALGMAAFERHVDGSFRALAPIPRWFERLAGDGTFPFLGHILEEATRHWNKGDAAKPREWGPSAETDETGREFHYMVTALTLSGRSVLIFSLDTASDRMQKVLQKVREQGLATEQREEKERKDREAR
jgi:hypothetical protein